MGVVGDGERGHGPSTPAFHTHIRCVRAKGEGYKLSKKQSTQSVGLCAGDRWMCVGGCVSEWSVPAG